MPRDERFTPRDKRTHKMTKDGLVEVNQTTGEEHRVSQRGQDFQMRRDTPEHQSFSGREPPAGDFHRQRGGPQTGQVRSGSPGTPQSNTPGQHNDPQSNTFSPEGAPEVTSHTHHTGADSPRSLWDSARPAPGETSQGGSRRSSRQQRSADNAAGPEDTRPQAQPAHEAPTEGPNSPSAAPEPESRAAAPDPAPAPHRAGTLPRSSAEEIKPDGDRTTPVDGRSRLRFGEDAEHATPRASSKKAQHGSQYAQKFSQDKGAAASDASGAPSSAPEQQAPGGSPDRPPNPKFQFAADELPPETPGKKLTDARRKAERIDGKLDRAREKLPTRRRVRVKKEPGADGGKPVRKIQFEKEVKTQRQHLKGPAPLRPVKAGANTAIGYGRKKLYQVEEENVGTKAAHRTEMAAEGAARSALCYSKTRPYRKVAKLQHKSMKANVKLSYQKALHDNPQLKSNLLSRLWQKQKIKRQYAKAAREAKRAGKAAKQAGTLAGKAAQAVAGFVRRHPVAVGVIVLLILMLFFIMTMFSSCSNMAGGGMSAVFMSSYTAADEDINDAELAYTQWETDLLLQVENAETDRPGYDEYRYSVDDVSHDPFELMAYLTAKYQDFTFADVEAELRAIFAEQYTLTFTEEIEVRYRTEYYYDDDGELQSEEVPYNWYILHVNLTARSFSEVVSSRMSAEERELFNLYMETKGNRQYTLSPFDFDWLPYVSCYFGYRIHPITGAEDNHKAIDIAVAQGTEIIAAHDGVVTTATWHDSYGNYIALTGETSTGKTLVTKYAHCSELLVSAGQEVKAGDVIAKVGSTGDSTGPHLHFEVIVDGVYLNPLFFSEGAIGGTAAPGTEGGPDFSEYPGAPMGDGTFAAMMEEAQKHLGKPYVFGAKGPDKFDCSGFVSWVLTHSGVKDIKTNAQGLYNACTPVSRADAQPGDLIFFEGTYSTSNRVTHVGIYIGNGQMIHAGKPISYASIDTRYWTEHFYSFGRI